MMSGRQASREAREDHAKVWMHRSQQNALCAWEDYATERLTIAQAAREKATVRLRRAESLASRRDKLRTVVRKDWQDWLKLADERRQSARRDIGSLEALRERAANVVATREASLREAALRSLDERAKADIDELRPYSAQARVEAMVQHRCNDIAQKRAHDAAVLRAEESFHDSWSARVQVPLPATSQEPTPSEEKHPVRAAIEKREQREVLRQAWAENQTDRLLAQQAEARRDQEFLFKWVGMDKDAGRTDGNMYIWRDEEKALGEGEDDDERDGNFVQAKLALDLDFDRVAGDHQAAEIFKQQFVADMAATLGCDPSAINVDGLEAGSVIVQFRITDTGSGVNPADLLKDLSDKCASGDLVVAGGGAKGLEDLTPNAEKLALHKLKMASRRTYEKYRTFNEGLVAAKAATARQAAVEAEKDAREATEADAEAEATERAAAAEIAAAKRHLWEELQEQRRRDAEVAAAARRQAGDVDETASGAAQALWRRAEADLERRRVASERLQEEVAASLAQQVALREATKVAASTARKEEATSAMAEAAAAAAEKKAEFLARRERSMAARAEIWAAAEAARRNKEDSAAVEREAEKARLDAQRVETDRVLGLLPETARVPAALRRPGTAPARHSERISVRQEAPPAANFAYEKAAAADEWSAELDTWAQSHLPLRSAAAFIFLKGKFMAASSEAAAATIVRQIRSEFAAMDGGDMALRQMEPAFLDCAKFCQFAGQRGDATSLGPGLVPRLDLASLRP